MEIHKEHMYRNLLRMLRCILILPEVTRVSIRNREILSPDSEDVIWDALEASYHDQFSDVDIHIYVKLHPDNCGESLIYYQNPERLGLNREHYLGLLAGNLQDTPVLRFVLKNGMRYDLDFHITEDLSAPVLPFSRKERIVKQSGRFWPDWDLKKADAFWFIQVQALGKLYRGDYLIADHLANMQINETLVAQMVMRDDQYGTNIHRYGHCETLDYQIVEGIKKSSNGIIRNCQNQGVTFQAIADKLYAAAVSYDRLVKPLNSEYEPRSNYFLEIWQAYEIGESYQRLYELCKKLEII